MEYCTECACQLHLTCDAPLALIGNGFCNDETNKVDCNYDGGDCCGSCANTDYCLECVCYSAVFDNGSYNALVGNSFCNDESNNANCNYDGGDCCGSNVKTDHCTQCLCHETLTCTANIDLIGNGFCNSITNNSECNYDGGDCCGPDVSCKFKLFHIQAF